MKTIGDESAVDLLTDSVKIYSPTGDEGAVSGFFSDWMRKAGFRHVKTDGAGNAIGSAGRGENSVLLCGHIDTVPGRIPVKLTGGRLAGRGSVDAKSPMCSMLMAARRFLDDPSLALTVVGATAEEGDGRGISSLTADPSNYRFAVFGEPGGAGRVTVGYRGRVTLEVSVTTGGGHAGSSWAHMSAFEEASDIVARLKEYERTHSLANDHYHSVSVSTTLFRAGEYHNVVPARASFTCDVRVPPGSSCSRVRRDISAVLRAYSRSGRARVEHSFGESTSPYEASPSSLLVRAFQRAILLTLKSRPVLLKKTGTGDMNTFAAMKNSECVTYGPGDASLSHTGKESVEIDDYLRSIAVLAEALTQVRQLSSG